MMLLKNHGSTVTSVTYSSDGTRLVSAAWDKATMVWNVVTGVCLFVLSGHTSDISSTSFSSNGSRIAS